MPDYTVDFKDGKESLTIELGEQVSHWRPLNGGFRLGRKPDGALVLQRQWVRATRVNGVLCITTDAEWRDEATVDVP